MAIVLICPDPTCQAPARIIDRWVLDSTDGPVEHVKTSCASGHVLTPMTAALAASRGDAGPHPSLDPPQSQPLGAAVT